MPRATPIFEYAPAKRALRPTQTSRSSPSGANANPDDERGVTNPTLIVVVLCRSADDRGDKLAHHKRLTALREYVLVSLAKKRRGVDVPRRRHIDMFGLARRQVAHVHPIRAQLEVRELDDAAAEPTETSSLRSELLPPLFVRHGPKNGARPRFRNHWSRLYLGGPPLHPLVSPINDPILTLRRRLDERPQRLKRDSRARAALAALAALAAPGIYDRALGKSARSPSFLTFRGEHTFAHSA